MFMENASPSSTGIRQEAEQAARRFRLPFSRQAWKGVQGGWTGRETGNSIAVSYTHLTLPTIRLV